MSVYSKIRGFVEALIQIGSASGAQLKSVAGVLESRTFNDGAYNITRGAVAVGNDDYVTKRQLDAVAAGTGLRVIRVVVGLVSVDSATSMPANARVFNAVLDVTTPYSPGTTITLGTPGTPTAFQSATDNSALVAAYWEVNQNTAVPAAPSVARATVLGGPAVGAAEMLIFFDVPDA